MSQGSKTKHGFFSASGISGFLHGNLIFIYLKKIFHKCHYWLSSTWDKSAELFGFLPIRLKLSLIIGGIVIIVLMVFSLIVFQTLQRNVMLRLNQVCEVLIENLSESVYGDLIDGKNAKVIETVIRIKKTDIEGLKQVAIVNSDAQLVAALDTESGEVIIEDLEERLKYKELEKFEKSDQYEFYYPIIVPELEEGISVRDITLGVIFISFSKEKTLARLKQARNIALGSAFIITLLSVICIYIIAKKMVYQIHLISSGAREVGDGNLDTIISVTSNDELGKLAAEFNNMIQHLREKSQMQKFVSKLTVQMIKDTAHTNGQNLKATRRKVAVLFSDIRNFSTIAEKLPPEEIVKLINIYFNLQTKIIEGHTGIVDKFMGDQIMSIFEGHNMADNALRAAVEIQRQIRMLNQERNTLGQVTLETGIGINNGAIVMGHMGSAHRMDYTVIGDVVNVAARLCANAKAGQIITSFELARKVNGSYPTTRLKSISVKGRINLIDVCEVDYDRDILT